MCDSCGCHDHHHHDHPPDLHLHEMERDLLSANHRAAQTNREWLASEGLLALNLISAPGSGKTALLERMAQDRPFEFAVITGDQRTQRDKERLERAGVRAFQIETGAACHLDAQMVHQGLHHLLPASEFMIWIENIGNMVCPTAFDLGERAKVALISVTEGEDKPLKYPDLLITATALVYTKLDLLPHLEFDLEQSIRWAKSIHPGLVIFQVSSKTGQGMAEFYDWVKAQA